MATWCKELTHLKRPWCWERLRAGGEGDDSRWDVWMASLTQWTWVWVNSRSCWWTGRPGLLRFMGSQTVGHDWVTELNWNLISLSLCCWLWSRPLFPLMKLLQRYKSGLFLRYSLTSSWYNPSGFSFSKVKGHYVTLQRLYFDQVFCYILDFGEYFLGI